MVLFFIDLVANGKTESRGDDLVVLKRLGRGKRCINVMLIAKTGDNVFSMVIAKKNRAVEKFPTVRKDKNEYCDENPR
jgi:hypothetical protein